MAVIRLFLVPAVLISGWHAAADEIEYFDVRGKRQSVEARIYAEDTQHTILLRDDGALDIVPSALISKRTPKDGPHAITPEDYLQRLEEEFGAELFRGIAVDPYVVGVVLQAPIHEANEERMQRALTKSADYMRNIEESFDRFMSSLEIPVTVPEFPQVLLIFESDDQFEEYANENFGKSGPFADQVKGFYSNVSNVLYVRMSECASFDTPLHEAIHQLCFNRGIFQRMAPVPTWLAEGMACSFEGSGATSRGNPRKLNAEYSALLINRYTERPLTPGQRQSNAAWNSMVVDDSRFRAADAGSVAYVDGWSLHWILVSRHREEYAEYLKAVQELRPLVESDDEIRLQDFIDAFGARPATFWKEFVRDFSAKAPDNRAVKQAMDRDGLYRRESHLAAVSLLAAIDSQGLRADGELKNVSPFRVMTYYVCVLTDSGQKLEWLLPAVRMGKVIRLERRRAGGGGSTFRVFVRSAPANSPTAAAWTAGRLPQVVGARK